MLATSTLIRPQCTLIEVIMQADTAGNSVSPAYFPMDVQKFMLNRKLIALESYHDLAIPMSPISMGVRTAPLAPWLSATLTLLREPGNGVPGGDFYKNMPLFTMNRTYNRVIRPYSPELWRCDPVNIAWSDSFITLNTSISITDPISFPFLATWIFDDQDPAPYTNVKLKQRR